MAQIERGEAKIQRRISIKKALEAKVRNSSKRSNQHLKVMLRIPVQWRVFRNLLHQRCDLRLGWSVKDSLTKLHAMFAIFSLKLLKISPWAWGCNPKNWRQRVNVYRCNLTISPNRSLSVPYFCVFFFVLFRKLFTRQMQTWITASGLGFLVRQPIIIGMVQVSSEDESSGITKLRNPRCNPR